MHLFFYGLENLLLTLFSPLPMIKLLVFSFKLPLLCSAPSCRSRDSERHTSALLSSPCKTLPIGVLRETTHLGEEEQTCSHVFPAAFIFFKCILIEM